MQINHQASQVHPARQGRATRPSAGGIFIGTSSRFFLARPGQVKLNELTDPDYKAQLAEFLRTYGRCGTADFSRKASEETLRNRTDILYKTFRLIMADKRLSSLSQITPRYLPRIFELWEQEGLGARARINYFTNMRWFWRICGIEIEPIKKFEKYPDEYTIPRTAQSDHSWKGNGIDIESIYRKVHEIDPVAARLMKAIQTYGMRVKESLRLKPHESDSGNALDILHGAKTGRARRFNFDDFEADDFRQVLDELKGEVSEEDHLAWKNRTLKQAKRRMYHIAERVGVTKAQLGVSWHGLRHDFAIDQFEKLTGLPAPIRGGLGIDYRAVSEQIQKITRAMGHNRGEITGTYYGSTLGLERQQMRNFMQSWNKIESVIDDIGALILGNGGSNMFWIGDRAVGNLKNRAVAFEFVLEPGMDPNVAARVCPQIAELVVLATGLDCSVRPWEALPGVQQLVWETEAVPILAAVSPMDAMRARLKEQRSAALPSNANNKSDSGD